jgi:hypothetical protein
MTRRERATFFKHQQEVRNDKRLRFPRPYDPGFRYYKGRHKGELRTVFEVDGRMFNELWELVRPYVFVSTLKSYAYSQTAGDIEEDVMDVRAQMLYVLRYFGGTPYRKKFSVYMVLIVTNKLWTSARRRGAPTRPTFCETCEKLLKYKTAKKHELRGHVIIPDPNARDRGVRTRVSRTSERLDPALHHSAVGTEEIEFWAGIPDVLKDTVQQIINGERLSEIAASQVSHLSAKVSSTLFSKLRQQQSRALKETLVKRLDLQP